MAQIISLDEALGARTRPPSSGISQPEIPPSVACRPARLPDREGVFRAILLLDVAAQHSRLLVGQVSDPPLRARLDAQIEKIELLLQAARDIALKL